MSARRLEGKVALITGAARGQGRAHAVRLAREGADVIAIDVNKSAGTTAYPGPTPDDLAETARLVEEQGRRVVAREADVRDFAGLSAAVQEGVAELGRLDVVIANAGICSANPSWEISVEQWQETIDTNLTGVFFTAKATVPLLIEQGTGGSIIITSSVAGLRGLPFLGHYAATKHGVVGLARSMANELGQHGIRVNTIHPHGVATGMTVDDLQPLITQHAATLGPIFMQTLPDPVSQPEDIANAVAWLASDEARHVTGIQLPIDLGTLTR
ncbi:mycofactocin-coupled SDR family oxidoreductase [Modestobacter roseus]|uniref:SDR family mycofactocin-dependent oxidoreductase n=1 Tax=Modestobacter roseus TaxID=1181884 RepID=A0A562IX16_9ACTN|nr:mycofactocin-coupled SDR family oxidoreductase [Modestobacter roseus]MQA35788.1 mycofactocin-coupled SDR family oxidoreductase [Modestobacter roseus]TWH75145.1 SDR family mycofactocin-dependent oxidoreductase [Modestobacter roseus]